MAPTYIAGRFPGMVIRNREVAGFRLTETGYGANQRLAQHCHEQANFVIVLRGTFTERLATKTRWCAPSKVVFRPPGELHGDHFHRAGGHCLTIEVPALWFDAAREYSIHINESADFQSGLLSTVTARLYREFCRTDAVSSLALEGLTLEMIAEASRLYGGELNLKPSFRVEQARELIQAQFCDHLTLSLIAKSLGTHPVSLAREFRRRYHCTVGEYIRQLRVEFACRQMADTEATIAEIATASGFFDESHFSRTFKRLTGATPARFRKNIQSH